MPKSTSVAQRVQMVERHQQGVSLMQIADEMQVNLYTVRKWWRRYQRTGWAGVQPKMPQGHQALVTFDPLVRYVALRLKRQHPGWGPNLLLYKMRQRTSLVGLRLPKRSALAAYVQPYLARIRGRRQALVRPPQPAVSATQHVHQRWQMDFKGDLTLPPLGVVQPWNLCDEYSGVPLATVIYAAPHGKATRQVTFRTIQANLRQAFCQWGLPEQLRMDRDAIWFGSSLFEWPGTLLLWLVGLGVQPVINRPFRPTDNAVVERLNRTWYEQVALGSTAPSLAQLQDDTNCAWGERRTALPSANRHCQGRIPAQAFPHLFQPRRRFSLESEAHLFAIARVHRYLVGWRWLRKVDKVGRISLANHAYTVGRPLAAQTVEVTFDHATTDFCIRTLAGDLIRHLTLPFVTTDFILGLDTS